MKKVKVLIVHKKNETIEKLHKIIQETDNAEVIGKLNNKNNIYNEIIEKKPNMIFFHDALEIDDILYDLNRVENNTVFNIITDENTNDKRLEELYKNTNGKINSLITGIDTTYEKERIKTIISDYLEYID